jgi:hypothetical protein
MFTRPTAPTVSAQSTAPEDVQAWEDYYADCETYTDMNKPGMRDRF